MAVVGVELKERNSAMLELKRNEVKHDVWVFNRMCMAVVKRRFAGFTSLEGEDGWFNALGIWMDFDVVWRIGKMARSLSGASTTLGAIIRAYLSKFPSCTLDAQKCNFTSRLLNICELPRIPPSKWVPCWQVPNSTPPLEVMFLALYGLQTAHVRLKISVKCTEDFAKLRLLKF